jgi:hypothetical protein
LLDPVGGVPVGAVPDRWEEGIEHWRVGRRLVGHDFIRSDPGRPDSLLEEPTRRLAIPPRRDIHVDDLPELVDGAVDIPPPTGDLHIGLVHLPAISHAVPAGPSGVGQQRCEPQHPPVDRDVVDLDTALAEELFDVA